MFWFEVVARPCMVSEMDTPQRKYALEVLSHMIALVAASGQFLLDPLQGRTSREV